MHDIRGSVGDLRAGIIACCAGETTDICADAPEAGGGISSASRAQVLVPSAAGDDHDAIADIQGLLAPIAGRVPIRLALGSLIAEEPDLVRVIAPTHPDRVWGDIISPAADGDIGLMASWDSILSRARELAEARCSAVVENVDVGMALMEANDLYSCRTEVLGCVGPGLRVRHALPSEYWMLVRLYGDRGVAHHIVERPFPLLSSREEGTMPRSRRSQPLDSFSLVACVDGEPIGHVGLRRNVDFGRRHSASIGLAVASTHTRQGVGSVLLAIAVDIGERWLGLQRIEALTFADDPVAIRMLEAGGFVTEGRHRAHSWRDGVSA